MTNFWLWSSAFPGGYPRGCRQSRRWDRPSANGWDHSARTNGSTMPFGAVEFDVDRGDVANRPAARGA